MQRIAPRYTIDREDRLTSVNEAWLDFAASNRASNLSSESVVGTALWKYIAGEETQHLYQMVFARVRAQDTQIILPFRCDSPDRRRFMRLVISPLSSGSIQFDAVTVREQERPPLTLLDPVIERSGRTIFLCSWCKKARLPEGDWLEVEDAIVRLDLLSEPAVPAISNDLCPNCAKVVGSAIEAGEREP